MMVADQKRADTQHLSFAGRPASVTVVNDIAAAEPLWRQLEREGAIRTPYQRFDLLLAWQAHVGSVSGVEPFIVIGRDLEGTPLFLWPLGRTVKWPLNLIHFLGGKHVSFNLGLWQRDVAEAATLEDVRGVFAYLGSEHRADLLTLFRQPETWSGVQNPFALLPNQPCADQCNKLTLRQPGAELVKEMLSGTMRGRLRTKERRLQKLDGYRYFVASTQDEIDALLGRFFELKSVHMKAQGLPDVFGEPGVEDFIRTATRAGGAPDSPAIEIHALEGGGEMLAMFAGSNDDERFSMMFNTYTTSENSKQSPGLILLPYIVAHCADRGLKMLDLGVGHAVYKSYFCKEPEPQVDSFVPLSPLGRLAANAFEAAYEAKRIIKETPALWETVQFLRRLRAKPKSEEPKSDD